LNELNFTAIREFRVFSSVEIISTGRQNGATCIFIINCGKYRLILIILLVLNSGINCGLS